MNKQTMHAIRKQAQAGFTLIELIVVIVILGILAATALPKFANLGGDARAASMKAALGALQTASATAHGQFLLNPLQATFTQVEGLTVNLSSGYPSADTTLAAAAGLATTDYTASVSGTTIKFYPTALASTTACTITYTAASTSGTGVVTAPTFSIPPVAANCQS